MPHPTLFSRVVFSLTLISLASACTTKGILLDEGNSLLVNKFGVLCSPSIAINYDRRKVVCTSNAGSAYVADGDLTELVKNDLMAATELAVKNQSAKTRLLIYIHGGLNKVEESVKQNLTLAQLIENDASDWSYPRFLVWPSDGPSNYFEHALNISGGRYSENLIRGFFGGTATMFADFLEAIVDVPRSWYGQGVNLKDTLWGLNDSNYEGTGNNESKGFKEGTGNNHPSLFGVSNAWVQAYQNFCSIGNQTGKHCRGFVQDKRVTSDKSDSYVLNGANLYWSSYERDSANPIRNPRLLWNRAAGLSRISIGALAHGEIGAASWRNMKRRATNISSPTVLFDDRIKKRHSCNNDGNRCVTGAGYFSEILRQIDQDPNPSRFEITLIGHSMGAFVLNDLVNANVDLLARHRVLQDVVYMAAATSIKQSVDTMYNLYNTFSRYGVSEKDWPRVSNLMLNRLAEIGELMFSGLVPSGSLLTWIDDVYERPTHPTERTFGSEVNVYAALPSIRKTLGPYYTEKITFKSFDRKPGSTPEKHGEFNDGQFWKPSFWRIGEESDTQWIRYE